MEGLRKLFHEDRKCEESMDIGDIQRYSFPCNNQSELSSVGRSGQYF